MDGVFEPNPRLFRAHGQDEFIAEPHNPLGAAITIFIIICLVAYVIFMWVTQLSAEEIEEFNDIMQYFHTDPNFDDFAKIYNARNALIRRNGRTIKFWLWGVYLSQPDFFDAAKARELSTWAREIERALRRVRTQPTAELLDCVWSLYFATGETTYSEIIRRIANDSTNIPVRNAARWSYRSIMGSDYQHPPRENNNLANHVPDNTADTTADTIDDTNNDTLVDQIVQEITATARVENTS